MPDAYCYVVDDNDNVIDEVPRNKLTDSMISRNTCLYIFNSDGDILLAKRHPSKKIHPNMWGPSASGTVEVGESYQKNIEKEVNEELGIVVSDLTYHGAFRIDHGTLKRFTGVFSASWNGTLSDLRLAKEEVSDVKWLEIKTLLLDVQHNKQNYVPGISKTLKALRKKIQIGSQ